MSPRKLAFIGDAVWELELKLALSKENATNDVGKLNNIYMGYASAVAQASLYDTLHEEGFFTEEEEDIFRKGRNAHTDHRPRHASKAEYLKSTGFEAVIGWLYLNENRARIDEIRSKACALGSKKEWHNYYTGSRL